MGVIMFVGVILRVTILSIIQRTLLFLLLNPSIIRPGNPKVIILEAFSSYLKGHIKLYKVINNISISPSFMEKCYKTQKGRCSRSVLFVS